MHPPRWCSHTGPPGQWLSRQFRTSTSADLSAKGFNYPSFSRNNKLVLIARLIFKYLIVVCTSSSYWSTKHSIVAVDSMKMQCLCSIALGTPSTNHIHQASWAGWRRTYCSDRHCVVFAASACQSICWARLKPSKVVRCNCLFACYKYCMYRVPGVLRTRSM